MAPGAAVQDVLLKQAEKRFHGRVIAGSTDPVHGSDEVVTAQRTHDLPASKLAAPIGVNDAAGDFTAARRRSGSRRRPGGTSSGR